MNDGIMSQLRFSSGRICNYHKRVKQKSRRRLGEAG